MRLGDKVRLRISNREASTYFWFTYAGEKMTVVANDGNDVEPVKVDRYKIYSRQKHWHPFTLR